MHFGIAFSLNLEFCQIIYYAAYILPVPSMLVMSIKAAYIDSSLHFETKPDTPSFCIDHTHMCSKYYTKSFTLMQSHKTGCIALLYQPKPPSHLRWSPQTAVPCNPVLCLSKTTLWQAIKDFLALKRAVKSGNKIVNVSISSVTSC